MYSYQQLVKNKDIRRIQFVLVPYGGTTILFPRDKNEKFLLTSKGKIRSNGSFFFKNTELRDVVNSFLPDHLQIDPLNIPKLEVMLGMLSGNQPVIYNNTLYEPLFDFTDVGMLKKESVPALIRHLKTNNDPDSFNNLVEQLAIETKAFSLHL